MLETFRSFFDPPITADPEQSTAKLAWVVRLRWVAIAAQILSIIPALEFRVLERDMLPLFSAVVATLAFLNIGTWIGLRRGTNPSGVLLYDRHTFCQRRRNRSGRPIPGAWRRKTTS